MNRLLQRLMFGGSTFAIIAGASLLAEPAFAQPASTDEAGNVESITVTGTSISNIGPVGSTIITAATPQDIENVGAQSMFEMLKNVPALSQFGSPGQGQEGPNTYYSPNIHDIGASSSNSTLVLINGLRVPLGGVSHSQTDPSIIPTIAIERVDVLATGASSIYGSDAVAGVVNFITRDNFEGVQLQAQSGFGGSYDRHSLAGLFGTHWDTGSAMLALQYSYEGSLAYSSRSFLNPDHIPQGGTNFNNFNCSPATVQPNGSGNIFLSPTSSTSVANTAANSPCNANAYQDYIPRESRDSALFRLVQHFGPDLTVQNNAIYSYRDDIQVEPRGAANGVTVFSTGAQANPFYVNPPGVTATKESIRFDADALLGAGAYNDVGATTFYDNFGAKYHLFKDFIVNLNAVVGQDRAYSNNYGALCTSCADLALNGTTNNSGSTTSVSIPGTTTIVTNLPLTTSNALDVWNPPGSNLTSPAVLRELTNSTAFDTAYNSFEQYRLSVDGSLFTLPGGPVRAAIGTELVDYSLIQQISKPNGTGPANLAGGISEYRFGRSVSSAFAELDIPVVGPDNAMPFVQKLEFDISGRYDDYSDVGHTANPKFAANWEITNGLTLLGNYSTAFVAPQMDSVGDKSQGYLAGYGGINADTSTISLPVANFPQIAGVLPGCPATATSCTIGGSTTEGISFQQGGGATLHYATGDDWSIGASLTPDLLRGFNTNITLFSDELKGGVNSPSDSAKVEARGLNNLFTVCPTTCTAAQVNAVLATGETRLGTLPSTVYFIDNGDQENVIYLRVKGIDLSASYDFDTDFGHMVVGDMMTEFLQFDEAVGQGAPYFSVLNTSGFNAQFPSVQMQMRGHIGWQDPTQQFMADLFLDFTGSYRNWSSTAINPVVINSAGNPSGGGDKVDSNFLVDAHASYTPPNGFLGDDEIFVDASNLFNKTPPFYNSALGFDAFVANPIGRVVTIGLKAKF